MKNVQSEAALEEALITQLTTLGYDRVRLPDEAALLANLKRQLEKFNGLTLTATEFARVLNHLNRGNVFDRAKTLRDRMQLSRHDGDTVWISFLNVEHWCQNEYQVTSQVTQDGSYRNRYDVTLLINGLPLVQIELKRRGMELKEAFRQIGRYHKISFGANYGLFQYVQIFVISNGVNTKYYANNRKAGYKQTIFWTTPDNKALKRLDTFAEAFLEKCHVSKMICRYVVLHASLKVMMVLRPYQYYAVEAIIERVKAGTKNGYIWHTTGSGKTLTSFKASQLMTRLPEVHKVVFVVDRRDLDYQTTKEFNEFSPNSVDGTENTGQLVRQLTDGKKLVVTTIQKLNTAIHRERYLRRVEGLRDKRVVFIFDECHRSQFGDTHRRIVAFFRNAQLFGFTGTPIFAENAVAGPGGKRTTVQLFEQCLHKYVITNAIRDEKVLKFGIEYVGRYRKKEDGNEVDFDIEVEDIDTHELLDAPDRLAKITDWIIAHHDRKTHRRKFSAIFCVSSIDTLIRYYELFAARRATGEHDLRLATIFSYQVNEADKTANGMIAAESRPDAYGIDEDEGVGNMHSRENLEGFIADYNRTFGTNFDTRDSTKFYNYYKDIGRRLKDREREDARDSDRIDILLVVNMFLTGFDAKMVNTLYVDKNLRYHGLIQAFSRTNRIIGELKSQGNIVCFRNLKGATDDAIALFSNPEAKEEILMEPYHVYVAKYNEAHAELMALTPTPDSVDELFTEEEELVFVQAFRKLMRLANVIGGFSELNPDDLRMDAQDFEDFKSKYLDIRDRVQAGRGKEKVSILNDVDFELELIHRDEVNVTYIIRLLARLHEAKAKDRDARRREIVTQLNNEVQLRSKRELIEEFIDRELPRIADRDDIEDEFENFWSMKRQQAIQTLVAEENLLETPVLQLINQYLYSGQELLSDDVQAAMVSRPSILQRAGVIERIRQSILDLVERFYEGM